MTLTSRTPTRSDPEVRAAVTAELEWLPTWWPPISE